MHPAQFFVYIHGMQQGLVKPGLELVGYHQKAVLRLFKGLCRLRLGETVHVRLGVILSPVFHRP